MSSSVSAFGIHLLLAIMLIPNITIFSHLYFFMKENLGAHVMFSLLCHSYRQIAP